MPCICIEPDEQWKFLKLYEAIDVVLRFQRKEEYFKEVMIEYQNAKYSEINLKIWAAKNEKIGIKECESFSASYLKEESDHEESNSLRI